MNIKIIIILLSSLFITGCAPSYLQRNHLSMIRTGTSQEEVDYYLDKVDIERKVLFENDGVEYLAKMYQLQTGTNETMSMVCTPVCIAVPVYIPVTASYAFIFKVMSEELVAWGLVEELSKNADTAISNLMPPLKEALLVEETTK